MRNLDPVLSAGLQQPVIQPLILAMLTFRSATRYVWSGVGPLVYDAQTYLGVGTLGKVGAISEGTDVSANGTTVTLSGIDPTIFAECLTDIQIAAPAKIWSGVYANGVVLAAYLAFSGLIDKPTFQVSADTLTINLALESRLVDLSRATNRRYTSADQKVKYPNDTSFDRVELNNDLALRWGS